jgi:regulator of protease activity HflC (stomatin/prohibitin superfamily)
LHFLQFPLRNLGVLLVTRTPKAYTRPMLTLATLPFLVPAIILVLSCIRQVNQYERGVKFTMGRFTHMVDPGWRIIIPVFQGMRKVDLRLKAVDVPAQDAITKDNVSAKINAVIYYRITDASKAVLEVENVHYAVIQLAQTTMRNIVGEVTLDELLSQRQTISEKIEKLVDAATKDWGVEVVTTELKDINLPPEMIRTIAKQAEAERERRAVIINAEGEVIAAENLAKAASLLSANPGALHLRTLNSINDISSDASNTVVFTVPLEILKAFTGGFEKKP